MHDTSSNNDRVFNNGIALKLRLPSVTTTDHSFLFRTILNYSVQHKYDRSIGYTKIKWEKYTLNNRYDSFFFFFNG